MTEWWLASDEGAVAAHLGVGKKSADRRKLRPGNPFIARGEREREGTAVVLFVSDGWPTARRSGRDVACVGFPYPRCLTGGPLLVFPNPA
jgi:hypothetical protein